MGFFTKPEYKEYMLDFKCSQEAGDDEAGLINIEVYGKVMDQEKCCYASYTFSKEMYKNGEYEQILELLKNFDNKKIKVIFKVKNNKLKDFKIDLSSLAEIYNHDGLNKLKLLGWSLKDKNN